MTEHLGTGADMETIVPNRELTQAQRDHLQGLVDAARSSNAAVESFVSYLRDEHDAPEGEFEISDLRKGFEPVAQNGEDG